MAFTSTLILCWLILSPVLAQNKPTAEQPTLANPYQAAYNHLYYLQPENFNPAKASESLYAPETKPAAKRDLAIKLKQILDGRGMYVDLNLLPVNPNYLDSASGKHIYQLFQLYPEIYLEKIDGRWYYSETTVTSIPEIHKRIYPFGSDFFVGLFPQAGQRSFAGLQLWQWFGLLILLILVIVLHQILKRILRLILVRFVARQFKILEDPKGEFRKLAGVISLLVATWTAGFLLPALLLPIRLSQALNICVQIFMGVFAVLLVLRIIDGAMVYFKVAAEKTENNLDDQLLPIVSRLLKTVAVIGGIFYIMRILNVNVTALIAGISIGGLALALAAQETVKNFIGSIMIIMDQPFQIGDWINFEGKDGIIEEVGVRSTRLRTFTNSVMTVPNGKLADLIVDNMGLRLYRRYKTNIGIHYDTPPQLIDAFVGGIREILNTHPNTKKDNYQVALNSFGDFSLNILVFVFFDVPDWPTELKGRSEVMMSIIRLASEIGVQFAFPTSTIHVENFPGQISLSSTYMQDEAQIQAKVKTFLEQETLRWEKA